MKNEIIEAYASAARTASPAVFREKANQHEGCVVVIDVTAFAAAPSVVFTIRGKCPKTGKNWTILASAAVVGAGTTILKVGRGMPVAANASANDMLPPDYEIAPAHGNGDSITYQVAVHYIGNR